MTSIRSHTSLTSEVTVFLLGTVAAATHVGGHARDIHGVATGLGIILVLVALIWLPFFLFAHFMSKGDLWGGVWLNPKTHEESRQDNERRERFWKSFAPIASVCFVVGVVLLIVGAVASV